MRCMWGTCAHLSRSPPRASGRRPSRLRRPGRAQTQTAARPALCRSTSAAAPAMRTGPATAPIKHDLATSSLSNVSRAAGSMGGTCLVPIDTATRLFDYARVGTTQEQCIGALLGSTYRGKKTGQWCERQDRHRPRHCRWQSWRAGGAAGPLDQHPASLHPAAAAHPSPPPPVQVKGTLSVPLQIMLNTMGEAMAICTSNMQSLPFAAACSALITQARKQGL